jgi:hypothetical protein
MPEQLLLNPWVKMWTKPKETIRAVVTYDPRHRFLILCLINGLPALLQNAQAMSLGMSYNLVSILLGCLILSLFAGMIVITVSSGLLFMTGKWIGGAASFLQVRAAVSWSNITNLISIFIWAGLIAFFGAELFSELFDTSVFTQTESIFLMGIFLIQTGMSVWSFVLLVQSLAEVQGFSSWKSVLNILVSIGLVVAAAWLLGLLLVQG